MAGTVFIEQLKRSWKTMLGMGIGLGIFGFYITLIFNDTDVALQYKDLLESFPPPVLAAFGLTDVTVLTTVEGFLGSMYFTYAALIMAGYAVMIGLNITMNDEDDGIMDMMLGLPIARWRIIIEKFVAYTLVVSGAALIGYIGIFIGSFAAPDTNLNMGLLFLETLNLVPFILAIFAVTLFIASVLANKRLSLAIAAGFVVASYFLQTVAHSVEDGTLGDTLGSFSLFTYFNAEGVIIDQALNAGNIAILLGLTVILVGASVFAFERRDIVN